MEDDHPCAMAAQCLFYVTTCRRSLGGIHGLTFGAEIVGAVLGPLPFGLICDLLGSYTAAITGVLILPAAATGRRHGTLT